MLCIPKHNKLKYTYEVECIFATLDPYYVFGYFMQYFSKNRTIIIIVIMVVRRLIFAVYMYTKFFTFKIYTQYLSICIMY